MLKYLAVFVLGLGAGWYSKTAVVAWVKKQTENIGA